MGSNRAFSLLQPVAFACLLLCVPLLVCAQGGPTSILPTLDELENRIQVVQSTAVLSADEKGALIQYFERTKASLLRQSEYQERARLFSEVQITAPEQIAALDTELSVFSVPSLPDPTRMSPTELQSMLAARRLTQRDWKNQAANLEAEIRDELGADISRLIAETTERYDELLLGTISNALSESIQGAAVEARAADGAMLRSRIDMLDQRLLSRRSRLDILRRQLELLQLNIAAVEDQIERLSSSEFTQSIEDADSGVVQAQGLAESVEPVGGRLFARAIRNVELAEELRQLVETRATLAERNSLIRKQVDRLSNQLSGLTEQLERPRLPRSPKFGAALLRQKKLMNSEPLTAEEEGDFDRALSELRLRQFELFEASQELWLHENERELSDDNSVAPEQQLANIVRNLQRNLIGKLTEEYTKYDEQLFLIDDQVQRLNEMGDAYQERVDRHLLWSPSAEVIGMATFSSMMGMDSDSAQTDGVSNSTPSVAQLFVRQPLLSVLAALLVAALLYLKRKHVAALREMRGWIGYVQLDRVALTLQALWRTLLLALPFPLAVATPGLMSLTIANARPELLPAFLLSALVCFGFEFFRQAMRTDGLAELHFHWQLAELDLVRRKLRMFMPPFLVAAVATIVVHYLGNSEAVASIGRIAYLLATLLFAGLWLSIARGSIFVKPSGARLHRPFFRFSIVLLGILLPLILAMLAFLGYQQAANLLGVRLLATVGMFIGSLLVFDFAIRAVAVSERKLALKRAQARRAAAANVDTESEAGPVPLNTDEIDLQTISHHSRTLITLLVSIAAVFGIGAIWADLPIAFEPLQSVTLWQVTTDVEGVAVIKNITLWNLLATMIVLLITYLGIKNIPGTLEVLVLSRMSLAAGTSYAVTSVVTYVIVLTGAIVALQMIGAQWSKVQWLIAALGVGLGFGLQEIVANFVSGILILFERPIRLGDTVTLGDQSGIVTRIRIRATTIMDWDRKEILIPNKAFISERLINWTLTDPIMRLNIPVGVAYDSDIDLVEETLLEVARLNLRVLDEPASSVLFDQFGDNSLGFELRVFVKGIHDAIPTRHELHKAITTHFRENNIEFSFPQRDIHFDSQPLEISILDPKVTS